MKHLLLVLLLSLVAAACSGDDADPTTTAATAPPPSTTTSTAAAPGGSAPPTTEATTTSTEATTTTADPGSALVPLVTLDADTDPCADLGRITAVGQLADPVLAEVSGVAASRRHPGVLWVHNDSGGEAEIFAIATDGTLLSSHLLDGGFALDWEDISMGPGPDPERSYIYIADIGDNLNFRPEVAVYRIPEPEPFANSVVTDIELFLLTYPEPGINAEAMAIDPVTGDLFLIEKTRSGPATMYRARAETLVDRELSALDLVGSVGIGEGLEVTAADISPAGERIVLRGYKSLWLWPRTEAEVSAVLQGAPCEAASPVEVQGEAATFATDSGVVYTVSEGTGAAINQVGP